MKSDVKEVVMNCESTGKYAYLSAEVTSLHHGAAVKIGASDTVLDILYIPCEQEGQYLQSNIFRLTGISRQTISSATHKLERDGLTYLRQGEGRNTLACLIERGRDFSAQKVHPLFQIKSKIWSEWTVDEQERYPLFTQKYRNSLKEYLHKDLQSYLSSPIKEQL